MKRKFLLGLPLTLLAFCVLSSTALAQDLVPGINYGYNPPGSDNIITDITVDCCNNESQDATWGFDVAMYLYDQSTQDYWIIGTTNLSNGLSGNACITISDWDIDIDDTQGIPAGTYRLGIWVDSGDDISETDEDNNAGLLSGDITYNPQGGGTSIADHNDFVSEFPQNYPNPVVAQTTFSFDLLSSAQTSLKIYNMSGQEIAVVMEGQLAAGGHLIEHDLSDLAPGIYYYTLTTESHTLTRKFVKQ